MTASHRHTLRAPDRRSLFVGVSLLALLSGGLGRPATAADAATDTAAPAAAPTQASNNPGSLEEVVVTARRRAERAQDVPLPITVISGADLQDAGTTRLDELQQKLPSTTVNFFNPRQASISIRGIGLNPAADTLDGSVGVFLDGVYFGRPGMAVTDLIDIDQFELLRGPQGTLFGKNTNAGALNITSAKPSFTPEATAQASFGNYNLRQYETTLSGPVIDDKVAVRVTAYDTKRDGILTNVHGGSDNDENRQGVRGQVLLTPTPDFSLRLIADYAKTDENCCVAVVVSKGPNGAGTGSDFKYGLVGYTQTINPSAYQTDVNSRQQIRTKAGGTSAEANWTVNDLTLTSISAYRFWDFNPYNDFDETGASVITQSGAKTKDSQLSQELRLASASGQRFEWVGGLYYFRQQLNDELTSTYGSQAGNILAGSSNAALVNSLNNFSAITDSTALTSTAAAFGQGTFHIDQKWAITAGLRETYERKDVIAYSYSEEGAAAPPALAATYASLRGAVAPSFAVNTGVESTKPTWLVSPSYKITDGILGYGLYSRGYKSAAINTSLPQAGYSTIVNPEKIDNFEIGTKTSWLDHKVQVNVNGFWDLVSDYQQSLVNYTTNQSFLANVGFIRTRGFELDSAYRVFPGLKLGFNGSYNDATYQSFHNAPCSAEISLAATCTQNLTGHRAAQAPEWIGDLGAEYSGTVVDGVEGYIAGDYSYKSGFYGAVDESKYDWIDGYGIANARIGARFANDKVDVSFWAKNLFDTLYYTSKFKSLVPGGSYDGALGDPLTFGGTVRVSF